MPTWSSSDTSATGSCRRPRVAGVWSRAPSASTTASARRWPASSAATARRGPPRGPPSHPWCGCSGPGTARSARSARQAPAPACSGPGSVRSCSRGPRVSRLPWAGSPSSSADCSRSHRRPGMPERAGTLELVATELGRVLEPLESRLRGGEVLGLLEELGFRFPPELTEQTDLVKALEDTAEAAGKLPALLTKLVSAMEQEDLGKITEAGQQLVTLIQQVVDALDTIATKLQAAANAL